MKNDYKDIINFINKIDNLKKVLRYKELKYFQESTADHSWKAVMLSSVIKNIPEISQLNLDWDKISKILLVHDLPELETNVGDVSANILDTNNAISKRKDIEEDIAIEEMEKTISALCPEFSNLMKEYKDRETPESRFASAINRLEATTHIMNSDISEYEDMDYTIKHLSKILKDCPELKDFIKAIKIKLEKKFKENNIKWKIEYDDPKYGFKVFN